MMDDGATAGRARRDFLVVQQARRLILSNLNPRLLGGAASPGASAPKVLASG